MVRLDRLVLNNFRGVPSLSVELNGLSAGIIGPNGSGKSSVADALDFLLTGEVRRLTGEGTGDVTLVKHGAHLSGGGATNSWVEGVITAVNGGGSVRLRRVLDKPDELEHDGPIPAGVLRFLAQAQQHKHHLLTRREILKYILAEPKRRGEQVAALLQLTGVDSVRLELQRAARAAADDEKQKRAVCTSGEQGLLRGVNPPAVDSDELLLRVNAHRLRLSGEAIASLKAGSLRVGLVAPGGAAAHPLQEQRTKVLLGKLAAWFRGGVAATAPRLDGYLTDVASVHADAAALKSLRAVELLTKGMALAIADECPLCLRSWNAEELRLLIHERLAGAREADGRLKSLRADRDSLGAELAVLQSTSHALADALGSSEDFATALGAAYFTEFGTTVARVTRVLLPDPVSGTVPDGNARQSAFDNLGGNAVAAHIDALYEVAKALPDLDMTQAVWDELTGLDRSLGELDRNTAALYKSTRIARDLAAADACFVAARDEVLQDTYNGIAERFQGLYRKVHRDDESTFEAGINPTRAGLKLEVDFYGRGAFPPCALHSEGHQDSMGLCLFLTLAEHLTGGAMSVLVLDDVLMSVDRDHRRAVAELLRDEFPSCQFIITTHDRVWWRQLRSLGVVPSKGAVEFRGWSLTNGPVRAGDPGDLLEAAQAALDAGNVPGAAHALRHAVETYFPDICDSLGARVRYRGDGSWGAGEFVQAAMSRYGELLRMAKSAAQSWGNVSAVDALKESDEVRAKAFSAYNAEQWAVNLNVHFNEWAICSVADFLPVLQAYRALFAVFACNVCGAWLELTEDGNELTGARCPCMATNWNLRSKPGVKGTGAASSN